MAHNTFNICDDDVFDIDCSRKYTPHNYTLCSECNVYMEMQADAYSIVCPKCYVMRPVGNNGEHTILSSNYHNVSHNSNILYKVMGTTDRSYQNILTKCTSQYGPLRDNIEKRKMSKRNYASDRKIPDDVLQEAIAEFIKIQNIPDKKTYRSGNRRGVIGGFVSKICKQRGIPKTDAQIAEFMDTELSKITAGNREVKEYERKGVIDICETTDSLKGHINTYFQSFEIDKKYRKFVLDLLKQIEAKNIREIIKRDNITKCIGIIYLLNVVLDMGITHDDFHKYCGGISRGTYKGVYNTIIQNEVKLRRVFYKHDIPTPW
jgi:transcription initiation factor TFIIIB Brf1 subunit/transcription initiation factor TFIIB